MHSTTRITLLLVVCAAACAPQPLEGNRPHVKAGDGGLGNAGEGNFDPRTGRLPDGGVPPSIDGTVPGPDSDGDGVPDSVDCDPASSALGLRLVQDDLATAKGIAGPAPGFDLNAWVHASGAFRQQFLHDKSDVSLFVTGGDVDSVQVEITAAATEIGSFNPKLRQSFVVVGASAGDGQFSGYGCGVEVVEGENSELKASVVGLSGSPFGVTTNPIKRADRDPLQVNEEYGIRVRVADGNITCTVLQAQHETTVVALGVGAVRGAVGLLTRQAKARFKNAQICLIPGSTRTTTTPPVNTTR